MQSANNRLQSLQAATLTANTESSLKRNELVNQRRQYLEKRKQCLNNLKLASSRNGSPRLAPLTASHFLNLTTHQKTSRNRSAMSHHTARTPSNAKSAPGTPTEKSGKSGLTAKT